MTESFGRRVVSCGEEDRISKLPEHLIDSVLEWLPTEDVVRTSIISKRWRYRWTNMRALVFDEQFFKKFAKNGAFGRNGSIRIINKVMILHTGPISKFILHIPNMYPDCLEEVDQWMALLSRNAVRELILTNSSQCYELPSYLFSCLELTKMKLENCFFKPPLGFEGFINLRELHIRNIDFRANLCGTQINLPQLMELSMYTCTNAHNFNIKATKVQILLVFNCHDAMLLQLLHSPCLKRVAICFLKPIEGLVRVERMTMAMMLSNLPKIEALYFDGLFFKFVIAGKIPKRLPHLVNSLKRLRLLNFQLGDMHQLHGALCLLRISHNLESIFMTLSGMDSRVDVGPASNHLEVPNCLDHTMKQLRTVVIKSLEGSRPELLFIKLLLAYSPSLESLTITPSVALDAKKILDIAKDVMRFPRASAKAEMVYLNPEPKSKADPMYKKGGVWSPLKCGSHQSISDLARVMVETKMHLSFPLIYRLVKLSLILPVATATVERCFSAMKLVKSDLRNRISDEFLNDCVICVVEREGFFKVTNESIIKRFLAMGVRRCQL